jgi:hypothetical protein
MLHPQSPANKIKIAETCAGPPSGRRDAAGRRPALLKVKLISIDFGSCRFMIDDLLNTDSRDHQDRLGP